MKHRGLIRKIRQQAAERDVAWQKAPREGRNHEIWRCGTVEVSIPRHREINEITAQAICKQPESELGKGWWR